MNPSTAKWVLAGLSFLAVLGCWLSINDTLILINKMAMMAPYIPFDTSIFYGFYGLILLIILLVNYLAGKEKKGLLARYGSQLMVASFIIVVLSAPLGAQAVMWKLKSDGYVKCKDHDDESSSLRGSAYIFSIDGCESLQQKSNI